MLPSEALVFRVIDEPVVVCEAEASRCPYRHGDANIEMWRQDGVHDLELIVRAYLIRCN